MKLFFTLTAAGIVCIFVYFEMNIYYHNMNVNEAVKRQQELFNGSIKR